MIKFFIKKSYASFKHLGMLGVIVSLSVFFAAFSVFSIISLSNEMSKYDTENAYERFGGDLYFHIPKSQLEEYEQKLNEWKTQKVVSNYTLVKRPSGVSAVSNAEQIMIHFNGVQSENYPIVGSYKVQGGSNFKTLLSEPDSILISSDLTRKLNKNVGDKILIIGYDPIFRKEFKIAGVLEDSNTREGNLVFTSLSSYENFISDNSYKILVTGNVDKLKSLLDSENVPYSTYAQSQDGQTKDMNNAMTSFFRGMSILGLFVGSLGILSSMTVLITKRRGEIAILKTVGYQKSQIVLMFLFELIAISAFGSLVGISIGYLFFKFLILAFNGVFQGVIYQSNFDGSAAAIAAGASIFSTILFTSYVILQNLEIKPVALLRDDWVDPKRKRINIKIIIYLFVILVAFSALSVLIVGDVKIGVGVVLFAMIGMQIAVILFRILIWLILRLPLKFKNIFGLAWINLRSSYKGAVLGLIAIFIGITCIGFIFTVIKTSLDEVDKRMNGFETTVNVVAYVGDVNDLKTKEVKDILNKKYVAKDYFVKRKQIAKMDESYAGTLPNIIEARDPAHMGSDISIITNDGAKGNLEKSEGVFIPSMLKEIFPTGTLIKFKLGDKEAELPVEGYYEISQNFTGILMEESGLIVSMNTFSKLSTKGFNDAYVINANEQDITGVSDALKSVSNTYVYDFNSLNKYIHNTIINLVGIIISIAALAILAGAILLINTASLEVQNRKKAFGIYKAIGFTNFQVRSMFLLEYGIMIIIGSFIAFGMDYALTQIVNQLKPWGELNMKLVFAPVDTMLMILGTTILILVLIYFAARKHLNTKPADLLKYE